MAHHNWDIDMFNFHSTFLNGKLDDDKVIFMELPPGYDMQGHNLVTHLCVAIYGSKQGVLKWYQQLWSVLKDLGFIHMEANWGVFVITIVVHILIFTSHVNDCTITGDSPLLIKAFKDEIGTCF